MAELDIARIKRNVGKMIAQDAPETDIDAYVASEGASPEMLRGGVSAKKEASSEANVGKHMDALGSGLTSAVAGYGETAKQFLGMNGVGDAATSWAARNAPTNYDPAFNKVKEGDLSALPRAVVESAPGLAADVTATTLGGKVGGAFGAKGRIAGAALAGLTSYLGRTAGDRAKETAAEQGNTADPTTAQKAQGATTALGEAAINQLGLKLGLLGGGRVASTGSRGVIDALTGVARKGAVEGVSNVAQDAVSQLGTTAGSAEGSRIKDVPELLASGAVGAAAGGAFSSARGARDVAGALRERGTDTDAATRVSNRIVERAGSPEALSDPKVAFNEVSRVKNDIHAELGAATKNTALSTEAQNAVNAARSGKTLSDADLAHIDSANDPALSSLARDANEVTRLTGRGQFADGKFEGGVTARAKNFVKAHPFLSMSAAGGTGSAAATLGVPALAASAIKAAPALAGMWAAGRGLDHVTGMRSPARSYTEKFADGGATRVAPAPVAEPVAPPETFKGPWSPAPLAKAPPGFESLLSTAVKGINRDARQENKQTVLQAMPLLRQLAAQNSPRQQASIERSSAGIEQGIANLVQMRPKPPLALPPPQQAIPMGAPEPQLALPPPSAANRPPESPQAPVQTRPTLPDVIRLLGAPQAQNAPVSPPESVPAKPSKQAAEVYRMSALAKQIADLHNEEVRRERVQTAVSKAPAKPKAAAPVAKEEPPKAAPVVEALKAPAEDDGGIPDFLRRTKPNGAMEEAMTKKSLLETAFKDEPDSPYKVQHKLENGKSFGMLAAHKEFADAGTKSVADVVEQIVQRKKAAGELNFPERRLREFLRPIIQAKRDLAYKLADTLGVDRVTMDQHIQAIDPNKRSAAVAELQRIKDTWPKHSKKVFQILSTAGKNGQNALTLWKDDQPK